MTDQKVLANWIVRCYNEDDKIVQIKIIKDRTEHEAEREAESDPDVLNAFDWTLTKVKGSSQNTL